MNQLLQELDEILEINVQYVIDNYIFYHDSIENYYSGKQPSKYRKLKFYLTFVFLTIFNVKYGLLLLYPNKLIWTPLKDVTMLLGEQAILVHALLFSISLVTISIKFLMLYYEAKSELKIYDIIVAIKARDQSYMLSQEHFTKIKLITSIIYYGFVRIVGFIIVLVFSCTITSFTIVAYQHHDYGNVITLWLWTFLLIYTINQIRIVLMMGAFFFYLPISVLNYKFDELIKMLRTSIRWNNENKFDRILESYDQLTIAVKQLSGPFNLIIGITYCVCPYLIAINIELLNIDRNDFLFIILQKAFWLLLIGANIDAFVINQISASISVRNKLFPRYLYPVFCWKRNISIRMVLKIDSFINRLNEQFVGFYCFNWFKFTKMAFYQYALTISSSYILISNFFNK